MMKKLFLCLVFCACFPLQAGVFGKILKDKSTLIITHNGGFFSCCSLHLHMIIKYFHKHKKLPDRIDSSQQFMWYKEPGTDPNQDIKPRYFTVDDSKINYSTCKHVSYVHELQYSNYKQLNYTLITPFVKKYFSPSDEIKNIINEIEYKYSLNYDNLCVLFYRGNDKSTETNPPTYQEFIDKATALKQLHPDIVFLIQSDETEFLSTMKEIFPNSIVFYDEIRHIPKQVTTVDHVFAKSNYYYSKYYLAITYIMSKSKHIICTSGNCSIWIMLFRGNCDNVQQFLSPIGTDERYWF